MTPTWTDKRVDDLTSLWRDGLSAAEIARRLSGVSRNAVLGKLHRLGLLGARARSAAAPRAPRRAPPRPRKGIAPVRRRTSAPQTEPLEGLVSRLETLPAHACRWPIGDPKQAGFRFCGRPAALAPYCPVHRQVAYRPADPPKRAARRRGGRSPEAARLGRS